MPATPGRCSSRPAPRPPKKTAPAMLFATCVTCGRHSSAFPSKVLGLGCWVLGFATPQPQYPTPKTRAESALAQFEAGDVAGLRTQAPIPSCNAVTYQE